MYLLELSSALGGAMSGAGAMLWFPWQLVHWRATPLVRVLSVCPEFQRARCPREGLLPPNPVLIELQRLWSEATEQADPAPAQNEGLAQPGPSCSCPLLSFVNEWFGEWLQQWLLVFLQSRSSSCCKSSHSEFGSFIVALWGAQCRPPLLFSSWCFSFQFWGGRKQQALGPVQGSHSHRKCSLHRVKIKLFSLLILLTVST